MEYKHSQDMGEISGFGGGYEQCCQEMLSAGVNWLMNHSGEKPSILTSPQVFGLALDNNPASEQLTKVIVAAAENFGGATGAQHHAVMARLMYITENGWAKYCEETRKNEKEEEDPTP